MTAKKMEEKKSNALGKVLEIHSAENFFSMLPVLTLLSANSYVISCINSHIHVFLLSSNTKLQAT